MSQRKFTVVLLLVLMLFAVALPAMATTIEEKQNELSEVQKNIKQREAELKQNKQEQDKVLKEIRQLQNEIKVIEAELRSLANKITTTESEIAAVEEDLAAAEEKLLQLDETLAVRLRAIHEHGKVSYLEVLLNSTSFVDFLTRYNGLRQLIEQDKQLLTEAKAERDRINELKDALEERRQELLTLRRDNINKKQSLVVKQAQREQLVAALQAAYRENDAQVRQLEAEAQQIQNLILQLQAQQNGSSNKGTGTLLWPVQGYGKGWITSSYGARRDPITGELGTFHHAIDIGIPHSRWPGSASYTGTPVNILAADSGVAYTYRNYGSYGNLVIVDHGNGMATVYAHTHDFLVANGQAVYKGQAIAIVGSTGRSTGPHLHFEVRINNDRVNPLKYLP
ncbi:MAG: peptidoglycan DD-metalloendopeptidase family protein [Firmicutes bacterium]|nr:peptidoglycan DD-metalloendopeptidase family protein [Bacillota bacterium]